MRVNAKATMAKTANAAAPRTNAELFAPSFALGCSGAGAATIAVAIAPVAAAVGATVAEGVPLVVGVGAALSVGVGSAVGATVGAAVGATVGRTVGAGVGGGAVGCGVATARTMTEPDMLAPWMPHT